MKRWSGLLVSIFLVACASKEVAVSYETPQDAFMTWKQAAARMDLETVLDSYVRSVRSQVQKELERTSSEAMRAMQREAKKTRFTIERVVYEDEKAYLRIRREMNGGESIEILTAVKERGEWKLIP